MDTIFTVQNLTTRSQIAFKNCKNCYLTYEKLCLIENYDKISYSTFKRRIYKKPFRFLHFEAVRSEIYRNKEMPCLEINVLR